jgi:hypothetical protein
MKVLGSWGSSDLRGTPRALVPTSTEATIHTMELSRRSHLGSGYGFNPLCCRLMAIRLVPMSICARTWYRGYRYYGFPNGSPGPAARV